MGLTTRRQRMTKDGYEILVTSTKTNYDGRFMELYGKALSKYNLRIIWACSYDSDEMTGYGLITIRSVEELFKISRALEKEIILLEEVHTRVLDAEYDFAIEIYDDWRE